MILTWLIACGPGELDEDTYMEHYAPVACRAQENCNKMYFVGYFSDRADCIDDLEDDYQDDLEDRYDECDFDKKKAESCLESMKEYAQTCEFRDIDEDCDEVWTCERTETYRYTYYDY